MRYNVLVSSAAPDSELRSLADLLQGRRLRRPRKTSHPALTRDQIVRTAMRLADSEGAQAITMRRIAADLGAGTMTLYGYVPDRDALLAFMLDEALSEVDLPDRPSGGWRADLELAARRFRSVCRLHPWVPPLLGGTPVVLAPRWLRTIEFCLCALEPLDADVRTAAAMVRMLNNYVIGTTLRATSELRVGDFGADQVAHRTMVTAFLQQVAASGRFPAFSKLARLMLEGGDLDPDESFDAGLRCLLDGIEARLGQDDNA